VTLNSRDSQPASACDTARWASARFAQRRSLRFTDFTARWCSPTFTAAIVCERLCQSITSREPRNRAASQAIDSVGTAGGFCTRITSGFRTRINTANNCAPCASARRAEPQT
jgi:hypothetical protein